MYKNKNNFYVKKDDSNYEWIDTMGKAVVPIIYKETRLYKKIVVVKNQKTKWRAMYLDGKMILPKKHDWIGDWNDGLVLIKLQNKWGCINKKM